MILSGGTTPYSTLGQMEIRQTLKPNLFQNYSITLDNLQFFY